MRNPGRRKKAKCQMNPKGQLIETRGTAAMAEPGAFLLPSWVPHSLSLRFSMNPFVDLHAELVFRAGMRIIGMLQMRP